MWTGCLLKGTRPNRLDLVSTKEIGDLRQALLQDTVPVDFETKLCQLAEGGLLERSVAQHCRCFIALLMAAWSGAFTAAARSDCEQLLRVLAYVRKNDDAIPDYLLQGFADDLEEVRAATQELGRLLDAFKAWRLRHQVPSMWRSEGG